MHTPYADVTWVSWHHKSQATQWFVQLFVQADIKENFWSLHHKLYVKRNHQSPVDWFPIQRASSVESCVLLWLYNQFLLIHKTYSSTSFRDTTLIVQKQFIHYGPFESHWQIFLTKGTVTLRFDYLLMIAQTSCFTNSQVTGDWIHFNTHVKSIKWWL